MRNIFLKILLLCIISSGAMASSGVDFLKWQVNVENSTPHRLKFVTNFPSDWFNPDDGMQFQFPKSATITTNSMKMLIPPNTDVTKLVDLVFLTYGEDKNRGLSTHMILFSVISEGDNKELCKIAFIGEIKSNKARIEKVLSNDINCTTDWNDEWYQADNSKQTSPVIIIYIKKVTERQ